MKGLLLKDAYMMAKYCRSYLFLLIIFTVVGALNRENMFFILYPSLFASMLPVTILSYDERSKWEQYCATLPCTKAQIVSGKYIIGSAVHLFSVAVTLIAQIVSMIIRKDFSGELIAVLACILIALPAISTSITLPIMFRYGTEKGRIVYFIMIGVFCAIAMFATFAYTEGSSPEIRFSAVFAILCAAAMVIYVLSWLLSIKFFEKREL